MNAATTAALDSLKSASKNVAHKAAEANGEFTGNKTTNKNVKPKPASNASLRNIEELFHWRKERKYFTNQDRYHKNGELWEI